MLYNLVFSFVNSVHLPIQKEHSLADFNFTIYYEHLSSVHWYGRRYYHDRLSQERSCFRSSKSKVFVNFLTSSRVCYWKLSRRLINIIFSSKMVLSYLFIAFNLCIWLCFSVEQRYRWERNWRNERIIKWIQTILDWNEKDKALPWNLFDDMELILKVGYHLIHMF